MDENRKRPRSESDVHPESKRPRHSSHPADAPSEDSPSGVSKRVFCRSQGSPSDAAQRDVRLKTRETPSAWSGGEHHLQLEPTSDTIKGSTKDARASDPDVERIHEVPQLFAASILKDQDRLPSVETSWISRQRTKSAPPSGQDLYQRAKSSPRSLHLDKPTSREWSFSLSSPASAAPEIWTGKIVRNQTSAHQKKEKPPKSPHSDHWSSRKQPLPSSAAAKGIARDLTERANVLESVALQEVEKSQTSSLTKANLRYLTHSLLAKFAEDPKSIEEVLEEWAFVMAGKVEKEDNVTTNAADYYERIREREVFCVDLEADEPAIRPTNFQEVVALLEGGQRSPEPGESVLKRFKTKLIESINEPGVAMAFSEVIPFDKLACSRYFQYTQQKKWGRKTYRMLHPEIERHISDPKPDHALGIKSRKFDRRSRDYMGGYAAPAMKGGSWILLVIEDKSDMGSSRKAIAQNCYSGAHCVNNILALKRTLGTEDSFYDVAKVFSFVANEMSLSIFAHWVHREDGKDIFWSAKIMAWIMLTPPLSIFQAATRACRNVVEHLENEVGPEIELDMQALATNLLRHGWKPAWTFPPIHGEEDEEDNDDNSDEEEDEDHGGEEDNSGSEDELA